MVTIVRYTDRQPALNTYPDRIVSPTRSGPCCFTDMETIGPLQREGQWVFRYRRCRHCGFTVRAILYMVPDPALIASVQAAFATLFRS
jgi:hypothetical protein